MLAVCLTAIRQLVRLVSLIWCREKSPHCWKKNTPSKRKNGRFYFLWLHHSSNTILLGVVLIITMCHVAQTLCLCVCFFFNVWSRYVCAAYRPLAVRGCARLRFCVCDVIRCAQSGDHRENGKRGPCDSVAMASRLQCNWWHTSGM